MSGQGQFKGVTTDVDKRHGDPNLAGLSSGEKAALSRGQEPKGVQESEEKKEAAERYMAQKQGGGQE
ncbi:hypothetical protein Ndes2526B_g05078 [Nannochloris sp. 'desiccata']|nr:hypothetical protein KSW81_000013 [Chlorella desiccata (nom. nud.)]KAH7619830.1 hypothetical protein NADE_008110 [Chlorella desiccata (nom. nud.)]